MQKYPLRMSSVALNKLWFDVYACVCHFRFRENATCALAPAMFQMHFGPVQFKLCVILCIYWSNDKLLQAFQHATVYSVDLTIIFEFLYSLQFLYLPIPSQHTLLFHRVSTISHLHWTTENRTCYICKRLYFLLTHQRLFPVKCNSNNDANKRNELNHFMCLRSKAL